jgi:hypothetical protein
MRVDSSQNERALNPAWQQKDCFSYFSRVIALFGQSSTQISHMVQESKSITFGSFSFSSKTALAQQSTQVNVRQSLHLR